MELNFEIRRFTEEELGYWLALHAMPKSGMGGAYLRMLVDRFQGPSVWKASRSEIISRDPDMKPGVDLFIERRSKIDPEALLQQLRATDIDAYPIADPRYPPNLKHIADPPLVLFIRGQLLELDFNLPIAIVGTRAATPYGQSIAKNMAKGLAQNGAVVISGLAIGIDSLAHWGAIEGGGRTVAVLPSGCDLCYPSSNKRLYNAILDGHGAVISEFAPGVKPEKWHFPARNRIVAGICRGVVVIEAGEESGALITAEMAQNEGRDVFAVPGRVDMPMSKGTLGLLVKHKAHCARDYKDVLNELSWERTEVRGVPTIVELYGREKEIYEMLEGEPVHFDVLCHQAQMPAGEMAATLTMLELAGLVIRHPGDWYARQDQSRIAITPSLPDGADVSP